MNVGNNSANIRKHALLSEFQMYMFEIVNNVVICFLLGLFGMVANVINVVIFVKQGLKTTVNINFLSLSVSDFCALITLVWNHLCQNPLLFYYTDQMYPREVGYLTGAWPHSCFARTTCWLTAYITAERCVYAALPLKSKQIVTPRLALLFIACIYFWTIALLAPQYVTAYLDWRYYNLKSKLVIRLFFRTELYYLDGISYFLTTVNGFLSFCAVTIFTVFLIVMMTRQRAWRKTAAGSGDDTKSHNRRDKRAMKMVLTISTVLICCYFPGTLSNLATFIDESYKIDGKNEYVFVASWTFFFLLEAVNSSVSILFYYKMSTNYRQTFEQVFARCKKRKLKL